MAAQQCRESRYFHGIICCYIGFAFFSPCKFQTGNPSRRCALQGGFVAGLAACYHAFLARSPDTPDPGAASPKAVRQRTLFSCGERKYISSQLQWIASECGNGTGKIKKIVVSKWGSGSTKCLLLNGLDDFVLNKICSCFASLSEGEISIQCGAELQSMMKM